MDTVLNLVKWLTSKYKIKDSEFSVAEILYHYFSQYVCCDYHGVS